MKMDKFEEIESVREAWKQDIDSSVIKAATKDWEEYAPHVQAVIEAEVRNRGLWEKVLHLRGEQIKEPAGNLAGYVCEGCKGTHLNFETGRCSICELPSESMGYCIECDRFWSLPPKTKCPKHSIKLSKHKAAMALLRFGNLLFDTIIFRILIYSTIFVLAYYLVRYGLVKPVVFENIDPVIDWLVCISLWFLYDFIFEAIWQRSPAKFITGTKVITSTGVKPSAGTIAIRTLIRFVPFDGLSFCGQRVRGWHDKWSKTYVIKAKRFGKAAHHKYQHSVISEPIDNQSKTGEEVSEDIHPQEESPPVITSEPIMLHPLEKCANCERQIGKLEKRFDFQKQIICYECNQKLNTDK